MSLALGSCGSAAGPRVSEADAIRIAEEKVSHDLAGSLETYHRINASYLADDRKWIVTYRAEGSGSEFTVEVDDRSGQSKIWMP